MSSKNAVLKIRFASSRFPSPILIPALGEPPSPIRLANAWMISVIGRTIPSAASASIPSPSILATYIRSTILYKKVISWAITAGIESRTIRGSIFPFSSSAVIFFCDPLLFFMSLFSLSSLNIHTTAKSLDQPFLQAVVINSVLCHIAADLICHRLEIFVSMFFLLSLPFSVPAPLS